MRHCAVCLGEQASSVHGVEPHPNSTRTSKLRNFENSILPLLPKPGQSRFGLFIRGWLNNNKIRDSLANLEGDIVLVMRRHMVRFCSLLNSLILTVMDWLPRIIDGEHNAHRNQAEDAPPRNNQTPHGDNTRYQGFPYPSHNGHRFPHALL